MPRVGADREEAAGVSQLPSDHEAERDRIWQMCRKAADELGEHCDSVRIFATFTPGSGKTIPVTTASGNWYASYGQMIEWLAVSDAQTIEQNVPPRDSESDDG